MKRVGIFVMIVALLVGLTGCVVGIPGFTVQYSITIHSTIGGTVTSPGEGFFQFPRGTVVDLVAEPDRGYRFLGWSTNAGSIADIYAATTTITMNENYCFVIANFRQ
ncbi:MAG: hypothetical protein OEV57_03430 [Dehalococcoidia bacterium]|nr:hypothetical protein [Dehalococcoidia bacterium]MDH4367172.1 hypothetical protein [Dehalococcoidia bacterium]